MMLPEVDVKYVSQKSIKSRAILDFLIEFLTKEEKKEYYEFPIAKII